MIKKIFIAIKEQKKTGLLFSFAVYLALAILIIPTSSMAAPNISLATNKLEVKLAQGEKKTIPVSFSSDENLSNIEVGVTPELQPYLTVSPASFATINKNTSYSFNLIFSTSIYYTPIKTYEGTIHIKDIGKNSGTYAKPISIILAIKSGWQIFNNDKVSFKFPTFGQLSQEAVETKGEDTFIDIKLFSPSNKEYVSQFSLVFHNNYSRLTLFDWFKQEVDLNGILMSSGTFVERKLFNDMDILVNVGPIPDEYLDQCGPVADFYAISPSGELIIILSRSQINEFDLYGYDEDAQKSLLRSILNSIQIHNSEKLY